MFIIIFNFFVLKKHCFILKCFDFREKFKFFLIEFNISYFLFKIHQ